MIDLFIDIETYSETDLKACGVHKYAADPSFEILLFSYSYGMQAGNTFVVDLANGERIPDKVMRDLKNPLVRKHAHNAAFETICISKYFYINLDLQEWRCTMIKCAMLGLPMKLDQLCTVLSVTNAKQKNGMIYINTFCVPCKPTKANGGRLRNLPAHEPQKWIEFKEYNRMDVEAEKEIERKTVWFEVPQEEHDLWVLDQEINARGVRIDRRLCETAIDIDQENQTRLLGEAMRLTGLQNPKSVAQLKKWLNETTKEKEVSSEGDISATEEKIDVPADYFKPTETLTKKDIPKLLERFKDGVIQRVLNIRAETSKTSVTKYQRLLKVAGIGARCRGLIQFYGANRTGRFAGRLAQPHNFPKNNLDKVEGKGALQVARDGTLLGNWHTLNQIATSVSNYLSQLLRTAFIPKDGHRFIIADYAAIEARVLAWLAGEQWVIDVFKTHGKIYEATASLMFKIPIDQIDKKSPWRDRGKVGDLACIAAGQLVLTDRGLLPIEKVRITDKVHDGIAFVSHEGVIFKGYKKVITYEGLTATTDHLVWTEGQKKPIPFGEAAASGARLFRPNISRAKVRANPDSSARKKIQSRLARPYGINRMFNLQRPVLAALLQSKIRKKQGLPAMQSATNDTFMVGPATYGRKTAMRKPQRPRVFKLRRSRHQIFIPFGNCGWTVFKNFVSFIRSTAGIRPNRQQWPLLCGQYSHGAQAEKSKKQAHYDSKRMGARKLALLGKYSSSLFKSWIQSKTDTRFGKISSNEQTQKLESYTEEIAVYDIMNCGPNNRFICQGALVHNCGYQGAVGALIRMGALDMGIKLAELPALVVQWRSARPRTVEFWYKMQKAAVEVIQHGGESVVTIPNSGGSRITFKFERRTMFIYLPSGRPLVYCNAQYDSFSNQISYWGVNQTTKKWEQILTYGGKITENVVQAISRDILREGLFTVNAARYPIVLHIHDEIITEMPIGKGSADELNRLMCPTISWAKGLPLKSEAFESMYYKKDD